MLPIILSINNEDDRNYVADIYVRYGKKIYAMAFNILNNKEDAEDCLHDVIKNIIDNLDRFQSANSTYFINLLVICTRNIAIDIYRKNKARRICEERPKFSADDEIMDSSDVENLSNHEDAVDAIIINEENKKRISEIIDELDYKYRDVLVLRYKFFMEIRDIANVLKITEGTVKTRLHRAKKILLQRRGKELDEMRKNG